MKLEGAYAFDAPLETVWQGLFDPEVLAKTLPGCDKLERQGDQFTGEINVKMGPVQGKFQGKVEIVNVKQRESYTMVVDSRGPAGFAKATANIRVRAEGPGTRLEYDSEVQVGGRIASVGQRLLDASSRAIVKQSLEGLHAQLKALADHGTAPVDGAPIVAAAIAAAPAAIAPLAESKESGAAQDGDEPSLAGSGELRAAREPVIENAEMGPAPSERPPSPPQDWLTPAPRSELPPGSRPRAVPLPEGVSRRSPLPGAAASVPSPAGAAAASVARARLPAPSAPSQGAFAYGVFKEVAKEMFPARRIALVALILIVAGLVYRMAGSR